MVRHRRFRRRSVVDLMNEDHARAFARIVVKNNEIDGVETEQWVKDLAEGREITRPILREASSTES